jgi:F0F1-type ATP synthase delta subunit
MKNTNYLKSIFEQISQEVFVMKDVNVAKKYITDFVNDKNINDTDKNSIVKAIAEIKNINGIYKYICNALLKYEGMGMDNINKGAYTAALETAKED